jgi:hypothetical protein
MANPVAIVRTGRHAGRHVRRHAERHAALIIAAGLAKDRSHRDHKRHGGLGAVTRPVSRRAAHMAITNAVARLEDAATRAGLLTTS